MSSKKMGRPPSDNPKATKLTVRIDEKQTQILDKYCEHNKLKRAEGIREGIQRLEK